MIGYRLALAWTILTASWRAWKRGSAISLLFAAACLIVVPNGQWGQPTTLGSAVIGAGLALAAASDRKSGQRRPVPAPALNKSRSQWRRPATS